MLVFDLESDGLLDKLTKIHVISVYNTKNRTYIRFDKEKVIEGVKLLQDADVIVGHNIISFDIPAIKKVFPWFNPQGRVLDTLVLSRLVFPDIKDSDFGRAKAGRLPKNLIGSHSLEAWGYRLREYKDDFGKTTDWAEWSQEMSDYCEQDVRVTVNLLSKIMQKKPSPESVQLEHEVATIIQRQVAHGFYFDQEKAYKLYASLLDRKAELEEQLQEKFPPWTVRLPDFIPKRNNKTKGYIAGVPVKRHEQVTFNPGSRDHIAYVLKKYFKWKPAELTDTGKPKVDEEVLDTLPWPEAKLISEYLTVVKRLGQLAEGKQAWLKSVKQDGRIHGSVITNGAVTGRMTHKNPNIAQVPAVRASYGKECRELFTVPKGKKLVGCDASGLELRCLAHYMARYDNGAYVKELLEGDIHTANQLAAGLPTRDDAKTFIYAFLYGAGDEKIGSIVGEGANEGKRLKREFLNKTPALKKLRNAVQRTVKERGYLVGLDGRHLHIRSPHAALNTLLQSAGALVMKKALCILDTDLQAQGLIQGKDYEFVANIHDEFQLEVDEVKAEQVGKIATEAIRKAGLHFKFRCPLDAEFGVGDNWAETH